MIDLIRRSHPESRVARVWQRAHGCEQTLGVVATEEEVQGLPRLAAEKNAESLERDEDLSPDCDNL